MGLCMDSVCNLSRSGQVDTVDTEDRLTMDCVQCRHIHRPGHARSGVSVDVYWISDPRPWTHRTPLWVAAQINICPRMASILYVIRGYFQTFIEASEIECRLSRYFTIGYHQYDTGNDQRSKQPNINFRDRSRMPIMDNSWTIGPFMEKET